MTTEEALKQQLESEQVAHAATKEALAQRDGELSTAREALSKSELALAAMTESFGVERGAKEKFQRVYKIAEETNAALRNEIAKAHAVLEAVVKAK